VLSHVMLVSVIILSSLNNGMFFAALNQNMRYLNSSVPKVVNNALKCWQKTFLPF